MDASFNLASQLELVYRFPLSINISPELQVSPKEAAIEDISESYSFRNS